MVVGESLSASKGVTITNNDSTSALYVHPSEGPGMMLVPVQFDGAGYRSWRREVMRDLSMKNKLGFINGSCVKPAANSSMSRQWQRCDDMGVLDITVYYTRMTKLWEELSTLNVKNQCSCICVCGAKDNMHKEEQDRRLIQFLMRLDEIYTVVRGNNLMINPLPLMAQAFSLLIQKKKQREFRFAGRMSRDATSLNASVVPNKGNLSRNFRTNYAGGNNNSGGNNNFSGNNFYQGSSSGRNALICDFCKRPGHTRDRCYKIHGYSSSNNKAPNYNNQPYRQSN
ncbi:hypothetical protein KY285_002001 [Solanum tuberosum]|nr:hypothetical protein KY285_002001 [Solanum tuberosum]